MRRVESGLLVGMVVLALAVSPGCGGGGNGNSNDNTGNPQPTPTTTPTSGGTSTVSFDVTATAALQGFDIRVAYPTNLGSFAGSGENVECTTDAAASFVKNDQDNGNLTLIVASASNLTFPINITCTFEEPTARTLSGRQVSRLAASSAATASDLAVTVHEVTANDAVGNPSTLSVAVSVS